MIIHSGIERIINNSSSLIIWGMGSNYARLIDWFRIDGLENRIKTIIDNDKNKLHMVINISDKHSVSVKSFEEVIDELVKDIPIIVTPKMNNDIIDQINSINKEAMILLYSDLRKELLSNYMTTKIKDNKVSFITSQPYTGHQKYLINELIKKRSDVEIVILSYNRCRNTPNQVKFIPVDNYFLFLKELYSSKVLVSDWTYGVPPQKRKDQVYIEVKHWSSITLKSFGITFFSKHQDRYNTQIQQIKEYSNSLDYAIVGSSFDEFSFRAGFNYSGKVMHFGSARSDVLFFNEGKKQILERIGINDNNHVALFAPTFRSLLNDKMYDSVSNMDLDFELLKNSLETRFSGKWIIMYRSHPLEKPIKEIADYDYIIDVSNYSDSQELIIISDVVITDYSSIMFEPAYIKKPVFLFAPDKEKYLDTERDFLIDYNSLPFPIAMTNLELSALIKNFDNELYVQKLDVFLKKYGVCEDGQASKRTAEFISNLIDGKVVE